MIGLLQKLWRQILSSSAPTSFPGFPDSGQTGKGCPAGGIPHYDPSGQIRLGPPSERPAAKALNGIPSTRGSGQVLGGGFWPSLGNDPKLGLLFYKNILYNHL